MSRERCAFFLPCLYVTPIEAWLPNIHWRLWVSHRSPSGETCQPISQIQVWNGYSLDKVELMQWPWYNILIVTNNVRNLLRLFLIDTSDASAYVFFFLFFFLRIWIWISIYMERHILNHIISYFLKSANIISMLQTEASPNWFISTTTIVLLFPSVTAGLFLSFAHFPMFLLSSF